MVGRSPVPASIEPFACGTHKPGVRSPFGTDITIPQAGSWLLAPTVAPSACGGEDQTIKLWDVATGQCCRTLLGHTGVVQSIALSPDGLFLVSATLNQSIRLWEVQTGQCVKTWQGYSKVVFCVVFHPNGRMLASSHGDKTVRLWDVESGDCLNCLQGHGDRVPSVAFSPDGRLRPPVGVSIAPSACGMLGVAIFYATSRLMAG